MERWNWFSAFSRAAIRAGAASATAPEAVPSGEMSATERKMLEPSRPTPSAFAGCAGAAAGFASKTWTTVAPIWMTSPSAIRARSRSRSPLMKVPLRPPRSST